MGKSTKPRKAYKPLRQRMPINLFKEKTRMLTVTEYLGLWLLVAFIWAITWICEISNGFALWVTIGLSVLLATSAIIHLLGWFVFERDIQKKKMNRMTSTENRLRQLLEKEESLNAVPELKDTKYYRTSLDIIRWERYLASRGHEWIQGDWNHHGTWVPPKGEKKR